MDVLVGLSLGILADGSINTREAEFISQWLTENANSVPSSIITKFHPYLQAIESDSFDQITASDFADFLMSFVGQQSPDKISVLVEAEAVGSPSDLIFDPCDETTVFFDSTSFVLSGNFEYGSKPTIEAKIKELGGKTAKTVTQKTGYLVVGQKGSSDWRHSNYGSKVARALELKEEGHDLLIIPESTLIAALS